MVELKNVRDQETLLAIRRHLKSIKSLMKVEVTPKQINPPSREKVVHQVPAKYRSTKKNVKRHPALG